MATDIEENPDKHALVELNRLWEPVRPHLTRQIGGFYGRNDGDIVEVGPFSGLLFDFARSNIGSSFLMALFPESIINPMKEEAQKLKLQNNITIKATDETLSNIPPEAFDLVIFRGAFFFPSFFTADMAAVYRLLKAGGIAFVGGGFGIYTPQDVIERIGKRSAELTQQLGRIRVTKDGIRRMLRSVHLEQAAEIIDEGGLWVILRKWARVPGRN
jgi:hypothetical protein